MKRSLNKNLAIKIWRFHDAPLKYQKLSRNGGDEEWLAFIPNKYKDEYLGWMEEGTAFGCCSVNTYLVTGGFIKIGAHA